MHLNIFCIFFLLSPSISIFRTIILEIWANYCCLAMFNIRTIYYWNSLSVHESLNTARLQCREWTLLFSGEAKQRKQFSNNKNEPLLCLKNGESEYRVATICSALCVFCVLASVVEIKWNLHASHEQTILCFVNWGISISQSLSSDWYQMIANEVGLYLCLDWIKSNYRNAFTTDANTSIIYIQVQGIFQSMRVYFRRIWRIEHLLSTQNSIVSLSSRESYFAFIDSGALWR